MWFWMRNVGKVMNVSNYCTDRSDWVWNVKTEVIWIWDVKERSDLSIKCKGRSDLSMKFKGKKWVEYEM